MPPNVPPSPCPCFFDCVSIFSPTRAGVTRLVGEAGAKSRKRRAGGKGNSTCLKLAPILLGFSSEEICPTRILPPPCQRRFAPRMSCTEYFAFVLPKDCPRLSHASCLSCQRRSAPRVSHTKYLSCHMRRSAHACHILRSTKYLSCQRGDLPVRKMYFLSEEICTTRMIYEVFATRMIYDIRSICLAKWGDLPTGITLLSC